MGGGGDVSVSVALVISYWMLDIFIKIEERGDFSLAPQYSTAFTMLKMNNSYRNKNIVNIYQKCYQGKANGIITFCW